MSPPIDATPAWELVALYDAAALAAKEHAAPGWVWTSVPAMAKSCGPAKAPLGLGTFEAQAMAAGQTPTLALLLRASDSAAVPTPQTIQVSLSGPVDGFVLEPAVLPRDLSIEMEALDPAGFEGRIVQLVRTQLSMELCLEHKLGRAWRGGDEATIREALLLDKPAGGSPDRSRVAGQGAPVPALLGPPDAWLVNSPPPPPATRPPSLQLVPSDIWGSGLRRVEPGEPLPSPPADRLPPLAIYGVATPPVLAAVPSRVAVRVGAGNEQDVRVSMSVDQQPLLLPGPGGTRAEEVPLFEPDPEGAGWAMIDLVAQLPLRYPTLDLPDGRYALLLVPEWQIAEGLRARATDRPERTPPDRPSNAVAQVLGDPSLLRVLVPTVDGSRWLDVAPAGGPEALRRGLVEGTRGAWPALGDLLAAQTWALPSWGYAVGMRAGKAPVVMVGQAPPSWDGTADVHRAAPHAAFVAGLAACAGALLLGLRRLADLWQAQPEERVDRWPEGPPRDEKVEGGAPEPNVVEASE